MFLIVLFVVIIPVIIISTLSIMGIILTKSVSALKEENELYKKKKAIIEKQYEELKNKE